MATIHRFEDLEIWQDARQLTKAVYAVTRQGPFSKDWGLADQVQRASVSVMTNIVEGFDSGSNIEHARFFSYARRSSSEVQSLFYVALEQVYITEVQFSDLYERAEKIRRKVSSFMRYLRTAHQRDHPAHVSETRQRANAPTR